MLRAERIAKTFGRTAALESVSCAIPEGKIYGLVGANGAGKSTLLRILAGIYRPDQGQVLLDGKPLINDPVSKARVILVPDELFFLPQSDLMRMVALYESAYPRFDKKRFTALCNRFNLPLKTPIRTFSKGMKRQSAILLALCAQPDYLLMDETFDGLDPVVRNEVRSLLYEQILERNMSAVLSSHSLRELEDTCDQLSLLYKGGLVFESEVTGLKTNLFKLQVAFGEDFDKSRLTGLDIVHYSQQGRVCNVIVRGDRDSARSLMLERGAVLSEILPLRLEEVCIYEMEALGYSFAKEEENHA